MQHSRSIGILVDDKHGAYVKKIARYSLLIAILLHLISAVALFALSAMGVTRVGYYASALALLLTALRPAVRAYEYIFQQLASIKHRIKYPRDDVVELRERVKQLEGSFHGIEHQLDQNRPGSFAYEQMRGAADFKRQLERVVAEEARMNHENQKTHESLRREAEAAIAKISSDTQFLDHVREIVRLIKTA
jgi:hypothetical protein